MYNNCIHIYNSLFITHKIKYVLSQNQFIFLVLLFWREGDVFRANSKKQDGELFIKIGQISCYQVLIVIKMYQIIDMTKLK